MANKEFDKQLRQSTLAPGTGVSGVWVPTRPVYPSPVGDTQLKNNVRKVTVSVKEAAVVAPSTVEVPLNIVSVSATENPIKMQGRTYSQVAVSFTRNPSDTTFANCRVWFKDYQGNTGYQLMASGTVSPIVFLCETTGETVTVLAQAVGDKGFASTLAFSPGTTVVLDGVVSAPPAPSVAQTLVATPLGYQFSFNQIDLGVTQDVIDAYRVYRNAANDSSTATLIRTFVHDAKGTGAIVVQDNVGGGVTYYYWVTSVNTVGLESLKTPAQVGVTTSGSISLIGGDIGVKGAIPDSFVPGMAYTNSTSSITWTWNITGKRTDLGLTVFSANSSQAITGLSSGTSYNFYPYFDENAVAVSMVATGGTGSPAWAHVGINRDWTAEQSRQDHIPLSMAPMVAPTTSAGTSTGGGGGDSGCLRSDMFVKERDRGVIAADEVQSGDYLWTQDGWIEVLKTATKPHDMWCDLTFNNGASIVVTAGHPWTLAEGGMKRSSQLCIEDGIPCPTGVAFPTSILFVKEEYEKVSIECVDPHVFYASDDGENWILTHNMRAMTY